MTHSLCSIWILSVNGDKVGVLLGIMKSRTVWKLTPYKTSALFVAIVSWKDNLVNSEDVSFTDVATFHIISLDIVYYNLKCEI